MIFELNLKGQKSLDFASFHKFDHHDVMKCRSATLSTFEDMKIVATSYLLILLISNKLVSSLICISLKLV